MLLTDKNEQPKASTVLQKDRLRMFRTIYNINEGGIENEVEEARDRVRTKIEMSMNQRCCSLHLQTDS